MGIIEDVRRAQTTDFKAAGDLLFVVGETRGEMGGTCLRAPPRSAPGALPVGTAARRPWPRTESCTAPCAPALVRSCHDLSDGGLWVALAESCLGGELGARVALDALPVVRGGGREPERLLFCETPSRFLVSVAPAGRARWERIWQACPWEGSAR